MRDLYKNINNFILLLVFSSAAVPFFVQNSYANNYKDFNQNVKNYNKNLLIFDKSGNEVAKYTVAIADNKEKMSYGLMNLSKLDSEKGMLFLFKKHTIIKMWMKNTNISLDMIFINNDKIISIHRQARPQDLSIISSIFKANKVLEINAGQVNKKAIKIGQRVVIE